MASRVYRSTANSKSYFLHWDGQPAETPNADVIVHGSDEESPTL